MKLTVHLYLISPIAAVIQDGDIVLRTDWGLSKLIFFMEFISGGEPAIKFQCETACKSEDICCYTDYEVVAHYSYKSS